ncbi:MAG: glycosyltransferase family 4 protein [Acidobacteriota bacterium]
MKRVAVIVQRCHETVVGGSESLAWQYANLLKDNYRAEVLTTTALHTSDWGNALPAGEEFREDVTIRRFSVTSGRMPYWGRLHERLLTDHRTQNARRVNSDENHWLPWSLSLQEEFVRAQGPYSQSLFDFLESHWSEYQALIFVTYLYATSYFGMLRIPPGISFFAPTLHDEEPAYLSVYRHVAHRARSLIWLTDAERRLGHRLWGPLSGRTVGMMIDSVPRPPAKLKNRYLLYCGRIDPNKGCNELFDYFIRFKQQHPTDIRLVLAGKDDIKVPRHPDIEFRGFVSSEEKFSLMSGATALVMPSRKESFSIVTLEAMAQGTPVIANGKSEVISDHVNQSKGGYTYADYADFANKLKDLISDRDKAREMGINGSEYVNANYTLERVRSDLLDVVAGTPQENGEDRDISKAIGC